MLIHYRVKVPNALDSGKR